MNIPFLKSQKRHTGKSFYEYSAKEKKEIIKRATIKANEMQADLVKKYEEDHRCGGLALSYKL